MRLLMVQFLAAAPAPFAPVAPQATVELKWIAPEECPTEASIRDEIDRRLSGIAPLEQPIVADASVRQVPDGLELELHLYNELHDDPVRQYVRTSCRDLADMAVDEISSIFSVFRARESEPAPSPAPAPPAPAPPSPPPPEKEPEKIGPPRKISGAVRIGGIAGGQMGGQGGAVLGGPHVSLGLLGPRWRLEAAAIYLNIGELSYPVHRESTPDLGVSWHVMTGQLTACGAAVARDRAELHFCGGGEIGGILGKLAKSAQVVEAEKNSLPWLALHAGPMISIRLYRRFYLWASGTAVFGFPGQFEVADDSTGNSRALDLGTTWFQLRGALGMEIRWGR